jgi:hypothetical protein
MPDLWKLLSLFNNEHVLQYKGAIFPNPGKPTNSIKKSHLSVQQYTQSQAWKTARYTSKITSMKNGMVPLHYINALQTDCQDAPSLRLGVS